MNKKELFFKALVKYIAGVLFSFALIFIPAGSLNYMNGWLFMILLYTPVLLTGLVLLAKRPNLLMKRLTANEKDPVQRIVMALSALMFVAGFILAGLNYRFGWTHMPVWVVITAVIAFMLSYLLYWEVLRENTHLFRTIEVHEDQKLVDTELYAIVRHPMYAAVIFMFLSIPLILNSLPSFVLFLCYPFLIALRIKHEEAFLSENLPGYKEYRQKVKYKVIPFIW